MKHGEMLIQYICQLFLRSCFATHLSQRSEALVDRCIHIFNTLPEAMKDCEGSIPDRYNHNGRLRLII